MLKTISLYGGLLTKHTSHIYTKDTKISKRLVKPKWHYLFSISSEVFEISKKLWFDRAHQINHIIVRLTRLSGVLEVVSYKLDTNSDRSQPNPNFCDKVFAKLEIRLIKQSRKLCL